MDPRDCSNEISVPCCSNDSSSKLYLLIVPDMLSCAMSAGQELLLRCSPTERSAPPVSTPAPSPSALPFVLQGGDPCWATFAANLPNDVSTISSNCGCDGDNANTLFWLDLTIFRMNTYAKRVGGGACLRSPFFGRDPSLLCCHHEGRPRQSVLGAQTKSGPRDLQLAFSGAAEPRRACLENQRELAKGRFQGCGFSAARPPVGVQLHPRRGCATVRLKVPVRNSREAAVPCA
jgi:hypothetical protein